MTTTSYHDPLTIAYIAMGASSALRAAFIAPDTCQHASRVKDDIGIGEDGIIAEAIVYADAIERTYQEESAAGKEPNGVWSYEVCEPFGEWFIARMLELGNLPDEVESGQKAVEMAQAGMLA